MGSRWEGEDRGTLVLELPEPPSLNEMLDLAKERRYSPRAKRAIPVVYNDRKRSYEGHCDLATRNDRVFPPREPWARWEVVAVEIRRRNVLDPIEALACLKWPIDWLVARGYVANDSPRELPMPPRPTQRLDRRAQGITLTIRRRDA